MAYTRVLAVLFDRRLPAGAFVSQGELVALTGIPVGPLRDALRVLETEGVLIIHPRTGIQFVKPGLELTRSTYQFRGIVESAAVEVFADTAPDEEVAELLRQHQDVIALLESDGLSERVRERIEELESLFHSSIVATLSNPLIDTSYRRIHNYLRMLRLDRRTTPPLALRSLREHISILEACQRRDPAAAVVALRAHFDAALMRNLGLY